MRRAASADAAYAVLEERVIRRATAALASAGVRHAWFKGVAVARQFYLASHDRPRTDADLLIAPSDAARADAALQARVGPRDPGPWAPAGVSQWMYRDRETGLVIDVHCRLFEPASLGGLLAPEEVIRAAVPLPGLDDAPGASPAHALWIAAIHPVAHHGGQADPVWGGDLCRIAETLSPPDWDAFAALCERTRTRMLCGAVLAAAPGGVPVPHGVGARLAVGGERSIRWWQRAPRTPLSRFLTDLVVLEGWADRAALLRRKLLPPREALATADREAGGWLPWLYLRRLARGPRRWRRPDPSSPRRFEPPAGDGS
ncbi:MAG: nucleotidyltransferase family protein [Acidobacteriota bacterium]